MNNKRAVKVLNTRAAKINFLQRLHSGKATIQELKPVKVEFWTESDWKPDIFTNEETGEKLTAVELKARQQAKGKENIFFIELRNYGTDEPINED